MSLLAGMQTSVTRFTKAFELALQRLAEVLDISDTHYEAAERSYKAVATWLNRPESRIAQFAPTIYSEGSFSLGTVIRPLSDEDSFDLDVVCEVHCSKAASTQVHVKTDIGAELLDYAKSHGIEPPEEEQYCWTMIYAESAQFLMDVVPAVPDAAYQRLLLESSNLDASWVDTAIGLTNTEHPRYKVICQDWPPSNPRGYAAWFRSRMQTVFLARRRAMALAEGKADIATIPEYRVKTPLQSAIKILKRHRDGTFADRPDTAPPSIILTTLSAHAYGQEETVADALANILVRMDRYISYRNGVPWIPNPTDRRENFADRWAEEPALKQAFDEWLTIARADFAAAARLTNDEQIAEQLAPRMGRGLMEKANDRNALAPRRPNAVARILAAPHKQTATWPVISDGSFVRIGAATVVCDGFRPRRFGSNGPALAKKCSLKFEAETNVEWPYDVYWQVVNTGEEARNGRGLRGTFEIGRVERGLLRRNESTLYAGTHSIECFIVKSGYCVAASGFFIVNIK